MPDKVPETREIYYHPDYEHIRATAAFLHASYRGDREYLDATDQAGEKVLIKLDRESETFFKKRKAMATVRNVCKPYVNRTNAYIFGRSRSSEIKRPDDEIFVEWADDVTGDGTTLHEFMADAMRQAQITGLEWIGLDMPPDDPEEAPEAGTANPDRPYDGAYAILHDAQNVVDWQEIDGELVRLVILEERVVKDSLWEKERVEKTLREWTPDEARIIELDENGQAVLQAQAPEGWEGDPEEGRLYVEVLPHDFGVVPFLRLRFPGRASQIAEVAHSQRRITNLKSWGDNELSKTFSTIFITGAGDQDVKQVTASNTNLLSVGSPDAKVERFGADPQQAQSIRDEREMEEKEVARGANLEASYRSIESKAPESGEKRRRDLEALHQQLGAMATAAEDAERSLVQLLGTITGSETDGLAEQISYPKDFNTKESEDLLIEIRELQGLPYVPDAYLREATKAFIAKRSARDENLRELLASVDRSLPPNTPERENQRFFLADKKLVSPVDLYMEHFPPPASLKTKNDALGRPLWDPEDDTHRKAVMEILERNLEENDQLGLGMPPALELDEDGKPVVPEEDDEAGQAA